MEKNIKLKTADGHLIYGVLAGESKERLIIFIHGLTGHKNEHLFYNGARFFAKKGFSTFRFDLYSGEKGGRSLSECTLETHRQDINRVLKYFKNDFKKISLVGHSLGGPVAISADERLVSSLVLWDPSLDILFDQEEEMVFDKRINKYILRWGTEFLLPPEVIDDWKKLGKGFGKNIKRPVKFIFAGNGVLYKDWKKELPLVGLEQESYIIEGATHCFDEEGAEAILFSETLKWFKR